MGSQKLVFRRERSLNVDEDTSIFFYFKDIIANSNGCTRDVRVADVGVINSSSTDVDVESVSIIELFACHQNTVELSMTAEWSCHDWLKVRIYHRKKGHWDNIMVLV